MNHNDVSKGFLHCLLICYLVKDGVEIRAMFKALISLLTKIIRIIWESFMGVAMLIVMEVQILMLATI